MVADSAVMSLIKLWGKAKQIKPQALKQVANTAIEYTPLLGFAKRAKMATKPPRKSSSTTQSHKKPKQI